ncbi:hypothetical protein ACJX0J_030454, partial [Zea mays]
HLRPHPRVVVPRRGHVPRHRHRHAAPGPERRLRGALPGGPRVAAPWWPGRRVRGGRRAVLLGAARGTPAGRPGARAADRQRRHVQQHARLPTAARRRFRSRQRGEAGRAGAGSRAAPSAGPDPRRRQRHGRAVRLHRPRRRRRPGLGVRRRHQHVREDGG